MPVRPLLLALMSFSVWFCLLLAPAPLQAAPPADPPGSVAVHLFWAQGCYHCEQEKAFLARLQPRYPQMRLHLYEITAASANLDLLGRVADTLGFTVAGVPVTIIGHEVIQGFYDDASTGARIDAALRRALAAPTPDVVASLLAPAPPRPGPEAQLLPQYLTLPLLGAIDLKTLSLPALTILFGALDGFNPCAMWVLLFLIGLLLGLEDRWRMWVLGTAFIAASAGIYFLFMTAWLNLLLFLGLIFWVRLAIALVALIAGVYNLKDFFANPAGACKVTGEARRQRVFQRLRDVVRQQQFWLALGGIILLAFAVNLVELLCSASLPVVYIQLLTLTPLPPWQYYAYLLLYIFIFMLDDLLVYGAALTTLQATGLTGKYSRYGQLLGGVVMLATGLLLALKPQWLTFG